MEKHIVIVGTGGTIAGQAGSATDLTGYQSGVLGLETILDSVPAVKDYGPFLFEQFSNIESSDITEGDWVRLAQCLQAYLDRPDVAGAVITHGTDSMEETAYFLHLVLKTHKPVVMTGSMRPAGAISADGPLHILQAVQLARSEEAQGKGVLVTLNGYIDGAREVTKQNTTDVATFGNRTFGHMGIMQDGQAHFYQASLRQHTMGTDFSVADLEAYMASHEAASETNPLPSVAMIMCYAGIESALVQAVLNTHAAGLILGGLGHGTIPKQVIAETENLSIPVVRASRTGSGIVSAVPTDDVHGYLVSDSLSPQKARILLTLALAKGYDEDAIRAAFRRY